ncbi:MAG: ABC transporter ATP-binding protein [Rhizobiaceae bacterium]
MIEIADVTHKLGGVVVLDDISLTLPAGGVTALIGPNGAGKSTLLSLVARLQPLQRGQIRVAGLAVDSTPGRDLARVMAILRQDTGPATRLRVEELVSFGRFPHSQGRLTSEDRHIILATMERFDLTDLAGRFLDTLSGGQRQRAWVAMVFCQGTDYVLLDEPLNNLDLYHARSLMQTLTRVATESGRTVVVVLHDVNHAAAYADRVVAMKSGRIVAAGPTNDVLTPAILEDVYGFRMDVVVIGGRRLVLHHA